MGDGEGDFLCMFPRMTEEIRGGDGFGEDGELRLIRRARQSPERLLRRRKEETTEKN